jgi:hypothetical protein
MLLIDTRGPPPDPPHPRRESWLISLVLDHLLPWPALVLWLVAAALMTDGWLGVGFSWSAVGIAFWRMSLAFRGVGGLRDYFQ